MVLHFYYFIVLVVKLMKNLQSMLVSAAPDNVLLTQPQSLCLLTGIQIPIAGKGGSASCFNRFP